MKNIIWTSIVTIFVAIVFIILGAIIFMICWNYVMPYLFGLPTITYIHALCLMTIAKLLLPSSSSSSSD